MHALLLHQLQRHLQVLHQTTTKIVLSHPRTHCRHAVTADDGPQYGAIHAAPALSVLGGVPAVTWLIQVVAASYVFTRQLGLVVATEKATIKARLVMATCAQEGEGEWGGGGGGGGGWGG